MRVGAALLITTNSFETPIPGTHGPSPTLSVSAVACHEKEKKFNER